MSRIEEAIRRAKSEGRPALVVYLCAGDPSMQDSAALVLAMADAGADVVEIGVPFSDPTADGPVIQRASQRALERGASLRGVLELVRSLRERGSEVPIILFGYLNPILAMGEEAFLDRAQAAGVDGLLVVDLPFDEADALREGALARAIDWVPLVAPNTSPERVARIGAAATSFVYMISVAGVTGAGSVDFAAASSRASAARRAMGRPVAVGFGVRTEADARALRDGGVDAIVVGSALVSDIETAKDPAEAIQRVRARIEALRGALASSSR